MWALLVACTPVVQGNGVFREEDRGEAPFQAISVQDGVLATVTAGAAQRVTVSGDANVVPYIQTRVFIDTERALAVLDVHVTILEDYDPIIPPRVNVTVPSLRFIEARGGTQVDARGVAADALEVHAVDGSTVLLAGAGTGDPSALAVRLEGGSRGGSKLDARGYAVTNATVALSGGSRAEVSASGVVTGTAEAADAGAARPASTVLNTGAGRCEVTDVPGGAAVSCGP